MTWNMVFWVQIMMVTDFGGGTVFGEDARRDSSMELEEKFEAFLGLFRARTVVHSSGIWEDVLRVLEDGCLGMG